MWTARTETSGTGVSVRQVERSYTELPSFDLVVATVDHTEELERLFESLERQAHPAFRVLLVDQNEAADSTRSSAATPRSTSSVYARRAACRAPVTPHSNTCAPSWSPFPDDDCAYPDDLLQRVAFAASRSMHAWAG